MVRVRAIVRRRKYFSIAPLKLWRGLARCTNTGHMAMSGYMSLSDRVRGRKRNHIADSGTPKEVPYPVLRFRAESDESHNRLGKIGVGGRPQWRRCDFSSSMLKRSRQGQGSRAVPRRYAGRQREGGTEGGWSSTPASGGGLCFGDVVRGFRVRLPPTRAWCGVHGPWVRLPSSCGCCAGAVLCVPPSGWCAGGAGDMDMGAARRPARCTGTYIGGRGRGRHGHGQLGRGPGRGQGS